MANPEHLKKLVIGVQEWNTWRKTYRNVKPDLSSAHISGIPEQYIVKGNEKGNEIVYVGSLSGIDLTDSDLSRSSWEFVDLSNSCFSGASLFDAKIFAGNLVHADLSIAHFDNTLVDSCNMSGADFKRCICESSIFVDVDLSFAKGLECVVHIGPSSIGLDTITKSKGQIPVSFLRGCGVPEDFIKFIPSLTAKSFEFYKCFISHSSLDMDFCKRLHADLQNEGVRVWFFPEDARTGRGVWDEIDKSIKIYDKLMVVCSEHSLRSGPVLREIERALQREDREHKHILFPVRIDDYIFDEWEHPRKADVVAKVVGDFSNWKNHDSYQKALDRLMRDLKASEKEEN